MIRMTVPPETLLSAEELAAAGEISPRRLTRLVRLGLLDPVAADTSRFTIATVARLRRMLRMQSDLGVNLVGAAIILDLMDRLERAQQELAPLRRRLPTGTR